MILADKIIENRKRNGWSQEELADKLGVSRQSVSKWEGAQAIPDMKKLLQMADLFGVTTDYLLRDDIDSNGEKDLVSIDGGYDEELRGVSLEEANGFLDYNRYSASMISTGVMLCILSPVLMILLGGLAETGDIHMNTEIAGGIGLVILLIMVAVAVAMFLIAGLKGKPYEYLENENIDTEYGVEGYVRELKTRYADTHSRLLVVGIMLCVVSAIPLIMTQVIHYTNNSDAIVVIGICTLLALCGVGVKMIVLTCIRQSGYDKLLEEGDYSRLDKRTVRYDGIYWAVITAVYLGWSFINMRWDITWIIWPIAGVAFAAFHEIVKSFIKGR
ncbi:MAG: helix-turn-helix transcriptional regulator [Erysipelotrichaceae bacterium]|nr:helix-turn-helix transcriptional regulator [Erysipelotrichaceae bacterium]